MAPRILVADDDAWILRMVTTVLKKRGYEVDTAQDGEEAYQRALENRPDLLITDVMMPKMDGWTLVKLLRAHPVLRAVPVIFLTALSSDEDRIHGFRLGADDFLPKPFRFEELDLRVAKTLRHTHGGFRDGQEDGAEGTGPKTALSGALGQIGLPMLLTMLEMECKSGLLEVHHDQEGVARLFMRGGRVVHAVLEGEPDPTADQIYDLAGEVTVSFEGKLEDAECVYYLLRWTSGRFEFKTQEVVVEDRVGASTTQLLMEGARRMDELNEATRRMDGMDDMGDAASAVEPS